MEDLTGLQPDGRTAANASGEAGRVVVVGPEPLLESWWTNRQFRLKLYGHPGRGHVLQWKNDLRDPSWLSDPPVSLTNLWQVFDFPADGRGRFFRARVP